MLSASLDTKDCKQHYNIVATGTPLPTVRDGLYQNKAGTYVVGRFVLENCLGTHYFLRR